MSGSVSGWGLTTSVDSTVGEGATEGVDFEADGSGQGSDSPQIVYEIPISSEKAILG